MTEKMVLDRQDETRGHWFGYRHRCEGNAEGVECEHLKREDESSEILIVLNQEKKKECSFVFSQEAS